MKSIGRIVPLDGIRAVAISFVLYAHAVETPFGAALGSLGVNLFFVLSGYLITSLLLKELDRHGRIDLGAFYGRRVRRIFPAYYVYIAVIAGTTLLGLTHVDPRAFAYDLLYLKNYAFNVPVDWWTGHAWSLCIEEQFYLIWPIVIVLGGIRLGWRFALGCILAAPVLRVLVYFALPQLRDFIDVMLPTRMDMIMFGCALGIAAAARPVLPAWLSQRRLQVATGILACVMVTGLFLTVRLRGMYFYPIGYTLTGLAGTSLILYVVRYPATLTARLLSLQPVAWLGRISYSLYLWQQPFLTPHLNQSVTGRFPLNFVAALLLATASYYLVERRFFVPAPLQQSTALKLDPQPL